MRIKSFKASSQIALEAELLNCSRSIAYAKVDALRIEWAARVPLYILKCSMPNGKKVREDFFLEIQKP